MQKGRQFVAGVAVGDQREGVQHGGEPLTRIAGVVACLDQLVQVVADLALVPGHEDRFNIGEVLVQRGPSDAGGLRDLGHGHRRETVLGNEPRCRLHDGLAHLVPVRVDGLRPQFRHL